MSIEIIRARIRSGDYLIKSHAVQHAVKEGFDREHMVDVALRGKIVEDDDRDSMGPGGQGFRWGERYLA